MVIWTGGSLDAEPKMRWDRRYGPRLGTRGR
jgi:hypothetical protein